MPLTAGDKLGPYKILALIGKGGMGEVYRALSLEWYALQISCLPVNRG
jgi:serine/threonine protein kinase